MICPHCSIGVNYSWANFGPLETNVLPGSEGTMIVYAICPECSELVILKQYGNLRTTSNFGWVMNNVQSEIMLFPTGEFKSFDGFVDQKYLDDYNEALKVKVLSPKSSAALTRRLLQLILQDVFKIKKRNLSSEIEEFINTSGIPSHLTDAVDAIRHIGNFAAHPKKDKDSGEIVDVEPGEADWNLEVIEQLFDFAFVQPKKLEQKRKELQEKLDKIGNAKIKKGSEGEDSD